MTRTDIVDFFSLWSDDYNNDAAPRLPAEEAEFWVHHSQVYDERAGLTASSLGQIATVTQRVPPCSTVLDIGGDTGRFALPLGERGCYVTVVDQSPDMLGVLRPTAKERADHVVQTKRSGRGIIHIPTSHYGGG